MFPPKPIPDAPKKTPTLTPTPTPTLTERTEDPSTKTCSSDPIYAYSVGMETNSGLLSRCTALTLLKSRITMHEKKLVELRALLPVVEAVLANSDLETALYNLLKRAPHPYA